MDISHDSCGSPRDQGKDVHCVKATQNIILLLQQHALCTQRNVMQFQYLHIYILCLVCSKKQYFYMKETIANIHFKLLVVSLKKNAFKLVF